MKKTYDWSLRLWITVANNQRKIEVVCSAHTNIHQLKIIIAKQLDLPVLDTQINICYGQEGPLKATSTLLQNQITNNSRLTATIVRTKTVVHLPLDQQKSENLFSSGVGKEKQKKKVQNAGLRLVSSCTNSACVNFNQEIEINYGFGKFPILHLTSLTKCDICPYKGQNLRPNMMCHNLIVQRCYYQLKGTTLDSGGIPVPHQTNLMKCLGEKQIYKLLNDNPWHIDMQLIVRPI